MSMIRIATGIVAVGFTALAGCASYKPSSPAERPATEFAMQRVGEVEAGAQPMVSTERQKAYFDANFAEAGVIAIEVMARNGSNRIMLVRPTDVRLVLDDGQVLRPASVGNVVTTVGEEGSVIGATIAYGLVGAMVAQSAEDDARSARRADYEGKSLPEGNLVPGESKQGFVFYIPPRNIKRIDSANLDVVFVDRETAAIETVRIPLTGIGFAAKGG